MHLCCLLQATDDWDVSKAAESSLLLLSHIAQLLSGFSSQSRRGSGAQKEAESSGTNQEPRTPSLLRTFRQMLCHDAN